MVQMGSLSDFLDSVAQRKAELGLFEDTEALRNRGGNRTPEKCSNLAAATDRALENGLAPYPSYF